MLFGLTDSNGGIGKFPISLHLSVLFGWSKSYRDLLQSCRKRVEAERDRKEREEEEEEDYGAKE